MQRALFLAASVALTVVVIASRRSSTANAEPAVTDRRGTLFSIGDKRTMRAELASTQGELTLVKAQFERAEKVMQYSNQYGITAGLAAKVFDAIPGQRKRLHIVPRSTHLTLYEDEGAVGQVAGMVSAWFSENV